MLWVMQGQDQSRNTRENHAGEKREGRGRTEKRQRCEKGEKSQQSKSGSGFQRSSVGVAQRQNQRMRRCSEPLIELIRHRDCVLAGKKKE